MLRKTGPQSPYTVVFDLASWPFCFLQVYAGSERIFPSQGLWDFQTRGRSGGVPLPPPLLLLPYLQERGSGGDRSRGPLGLLISEQGHVALPAVSLPERKVSAEPGPAFMRKEVTGIRLSLLFPCVPGYARLCSPAPRSCLENRRCCLGNGLWGGERASLGSGSQSRGSA